MDIFLKYQVFIFLLLLGLFLSLSGEIIENKLILVIGIFLLFLSVFIVII